MTILIIEMQASAKIKVEMKNILNNYCSNNLDSSELRTLKSLILIIAICCSFCGLAWSAFYYSVFGLGVTTILPLVFVVIVVPFIFISHFAGNYMLLVYTQLICILLVPTLIQWSLGSINDSGFVISWCILGPIGALLFISTKAARIWMLLFFLIVAITVFFSPFFSSDGTLVTEEIRRVFYMMNIGATSLVIFIASSLFLKSLKQSLEREKELGKLKSNFVTTASHQFRTPLAVIQSNAELLQIFISASEKKDLDKYNKVTGRITDAVTKMTELMDDVLNLSKLTSGKYNYASKYLNLIDLCEKLCEEFNDVQKDGRVINFVTNGEPFKLNLDPMLLSHSLSNLISNAFKFSLGKGNPELLIDFKSTELILSVKDYGVGISKDEQLNLFQPFFRADNVTDIKGTGLGLSIAKEYIEINKGEIKGVSVLGQGSCFEIKFKR